MPFPYAAAAIGAQTLSGLLSGGGQGQTVEQQGNLQIQNRQGIANAQFSELSQEDRLKLLQQQTQFGQLGLQRERFGQQTAQDLRGRLQNFADAPAFDTSSLQKGLLNQFNQQSKNTLSSFAQRGFGGSGAQAGALANQFASQVSLPIAQLQQQSFQNQRRNQLGALGQLGGLT